MLHTYKVQLDQSNVEWLKETHPTSSTSSILNLLLEKYREAVKETQVEYAKSAATNVLEEL